MYINQYKFPTIIIIITIIIISVNDIERGNKINTNNFKTSYGREIKWNKCRANDNDSREQVSHVFKIRAAGGD